MDSLPQDVFAIRTRDLLQEEARLAEQVRDTEERFSGMRDIDATLGLARTRLTLCLHLMSRIRPGMDTGERDELAATISEKGGAALRLVEGLVSENISEDQRGIIQANPLFTETKARMEEFLMAGGAGFLEARRTDPRRRRILSRAVAASLRRYGGEDDLYPPLAVERLPGFLGRFLLHFFPVMVREHPAQPPYGIREGEEVTYSSRAMKLPLSQAVFYLENELLPELEAKLADNPGSRALQEEIARVRARAEEYSKMRFFPRSTPVLLEQNFYTDGMTSYSADGELLVPIPVGVTFRSGTNLDRKMELVRMDVVRRIAGRGVSREIDREYRRLRRLESGIRGSSRTASMKIDTAWGYRILKGDFPFVRRLADKEKFRELERIVRSTGMVPAETRIEFLIDEDRDAQNLAAPSLPG
jgi:hypothetical protein